MRSGDEPRHARSALRLRLGLACGGVVATTAGAVLLARSGDPVPAAGFAVVAAAAGLNVIVVVRRLRAGPHWQPGRSTPPYRPVDPDPLPTPPRREPVPEAVRIRRYLLSMSLCLTLIVVAWSWVRFWSTTLAVLMSVLAALIPPIASIVANTGLGSGRRSARGPGDDVAQRPTGGEPG